METWFLHIGDPMEPAPGPTPPGVPPLMAMATPSSASQDKNACDHTSSRVDLIPVTLTLLDPVPPPDFPFEWRCLVPHFGIRCPKCSGEVYEATV